MRRPDDTEPDPQDDRAAERLKEFLRERAPVPSPAQPEEKNEAEGDSKTPS